jgi:hypothetical protein
MDAYLLNPAHLEIICNFIINPFKEIISNKLISSLQSQFKGTTTLEILYVSWNTTSEYVFQDPDHTVYYLRSLKTVNILTKYHLSSLMGKNISRLINMFGIVIPF